jgi:hypothetical protein
MVLEEPQAAKKRTAKKKKNKRVSRFIGCNEGKFL